MEDLCKELDVSLVVDIILGKICFIAKEHLYKLSVYIFRASPFGTVDMHRAITNTFLSL